MKQALQAWFVRLNNTLIDIGFYAAQSDSLLFIKRNSSMAIFILINVDDIVIASSNRIVVCVILATLHHDFVVENFGSLHFFRNLNYL